MGTYTIFSLLSRHFQKFIYALNTAIQQNGSRWLLLEIRNMIQLSSKQPHQ